MTTIQLPTPDAAMQTTALQPAGGQSPKGGQSPPSGEKPAVIGFLPTTPTATTVQPAAAAKAHTVVVAAQPVAAAAAQPVASAGYAPQIQVTPPISVVPGVNGVPKAAAKSAAAAVPIQFFPPGAVVELRDPHTSKWSRGKVAQFLGAEYLVECAGLGGGQAFVKIPLGSPGIRPAGKHRMTCVAEGEEELRITINKQGAASLGIDFADGGTCLKITEVHDGPIRQYNFTHPFEEVRRGHAIVEVNGAHGSAAELVAAIKASETLDLVLISTSIFSESASEDDDSSGSEDDEEDVEVKSEMRISIDKKGQELGLDIKHLSAALQIRAINSGAIESWNSSNPDNQVLSGHEIVEVNAVRGTSEQLLEAIKAADVLNLVIVETTRSPPSDDSHDGSDSSDSEED